MLMGRTHPETSPQPTPIAAAYEQRRGSVLLLALASVLVFLIAATQCLGRTVSHQGWALPVSLACLLWLSIFLAATWRVYGTVYSFSVAYILALSIFHLGLIVPVGLGIWNVPSITEDPWYEKAGWYTALALGAFGSGVSLALKNFRRQTETSRKDPRAQHNLAVARWYGIGLLCASVAAVVLMISLLGNVLNLSRLDLFSGAGDIRGLGLFVIFFPSAAILLTVAATRTSQLAFATLIAVAGFALFMISGDRSFALFPLLAGVVIWRKTGRRISPWLAASLFGFLLIAIPAMGLLRSSGARYSTISTQAVKSAFAGAQVEQTFIELGSSVGVLARTLEYVPGIDPYRYGESYVLAAAETIPNITTRNRAWDRAEVLGKSGPARDEALRETQLGTWIAYRILGEVPFSLGQGTGFTAIGEPYVNFGFAGVAAFFTLLGYLLGRLDQKDLLLNLRWLLFCAAAFWPFTVTVRNDMPNFTKPLAFIYICLGVWRLLASFSRPRAPAKTMTT